MVQDLVFGVGIYAGERIVENQDAWVANDGASYCRTLFLPSRKSNAALAHHGLILFGKFFDVGSNICRFRRRTNILIGSIFPSERNILPYGFTEQESFLRHETGLPAT